MLKYEMDGQHNQWSKHAFLPEANAVNLQRFLCIHHDAVQAGETPYKIKQKSMLPSNSFFHRSGNRSNSVPSSIADTILLTYAVRSNGDSSGHISAYSYSSTNLFQEDSQTKV